MNHTYYIPAHRKVYGDEAGNLDLVAFLYATYMCHESGETFRMNGVSIYSDKVVIILGRMEDEKIKYQVNQSPLDNAVGMVKV